MTVSIRSFVYFVSGLLLVNCAQHQIADESVEILDRSPASLEPAPTVRSVMEKGVSAYYDLGDATELVAEYRAFKTTLEKSGHNAAVRDACNKKADSVLCTAFSKVERTTRPRTPKARKVRENPHVVVQKLKKQKWNELQDTAMGSLLRAGRTMKGDDLERIAKSLLSESQCPSGSLHFALAQTLELHFPKAEVIDLSSQLLRKAIACGPQDETSRARFRLAMMRTWQSECGEAREQFALLAGVEDAKPFWSRADYWSAHCPASPGKAVGVEQFYKTHALSYHSVVVAQAQGEDLFTRSANGVEPVVSFRTQNQRTDDLIKLTEILITDQKEQMARTVLQRLRLPELWEMEPAFVLYVSYLYYRLQMGLPLIQTLAQVISRDVRLATPTTLQMFYPKWHFELVNEMAEKEGVDPFLVLALIRQESGFQVNAKSRARAMGLMQLLYGTARIFDRRTTRQDVFKPEVNVRLGTKFLSSLIRRYNGDVGLALAGYNAGPRVVDQWQTRYVATQPLLFYDLMPYRETREYVGSILRNWYWYRSIYNQSVVSEITMGHGISFSAAMD